MKINVVLVAAGLLATLLLVFSSHSQETRVQDLEYRVEF